MKEMKKQRRMVGIDEVKVNICGYERGSMSPLLS